MRTGAASGAWRLAVFWSVLVPAHGLLDGLLGSGPAKAGGGLLGTGIAGNKGLLGTGLLAAGDSPRDASPPASSSGSGTGGLLGTGLLGGGGAGGGGGGTDGGTGGLLGLGGGGGGGLLGVTGVLGNATGGLLSGGGGGGGGEAAGSGGLLGGALGGNGLLGGGLLGKDGLLGGENGLLGGEKGLLGGGLLGKDGLLGGENGLLGGNLLGLGSLLGSGQPKEPVKWYNAFNLEIIRGSWKVLRSSELILNFGARVTFNLPGALQLLSGTVVEMNITSDVALIQDKPGDLKLVLKNCQDLVAGFTVRLPNSLIAALMNGFINTGIRTILPTLVCPLFQIWFGLANMQLHALNDQVSYGLLAKIHAALSSVPFSTGQFSELDFKDKPFPGAFTNWLLNFVGSISSQASS